MIRPHTKYDMTSINKWLAKQGHPCVDSSDIPKQSYTIPGVAFCAVRAVEGGIGILDSVVTNPHVSSQKRNEALDALFRHVLTLPFKAVIGFSIDKHTQERAIRHGFAASPYSLFSYRRF